MSTLPDCSTAFCWEHGVGLCETELENGQDPNSASELHTEHGAAMGQGVPREHLVIVVPSLWCTRGCL